MNETCILKAYTKVHLVYRVNIRAISLFEEVVSSIFLIFLIEERSIH